MITVRVTGEQIRFYGDNCLEAPDGWWEEFPLLAVYIAAGCDESGAIPMVPEKLEGTRQQAEMAEKQLKIYGPRLVYDMGYYGLVQQLPPEEEFWPAVIANQYY